MKKLFALMLVCVCAFSLAACAQKDSDASEERNYGAGYDNPETCYVSNFNYLSPPEGFKAVSAEECGIVPNSAYVFYVSDDNHPNRTDCHTIYFSEDGSASIYICDMYFYTTMSGIYQYGEGVIFNIVTGDTLSVKSKDEIVFSKNGTDYIGVRTDEKWFSYNTGIPSCEDRYICTKDGVTYAYQFKEDETVDYYENDTLIETLPYYRGDYAVGFGGKVYCISSDNMVIFIGDDLYTLGGASRELPSSGLEYTAAGLFGDRDTDDDGMNEFGFYYDRKYAWVYSEDGGAYFKGNYFVFKADGSIEINGENTEQIDIPSTDLEYSFQKIDGKNMNQGVELLFFNDGKTVVYKYKTIPDQIFYMAG